MKLRTKSILFFGAFLLSIVVADIFYAKYVVEGALTNQIFNTLLVDADQAEGSYYAFLRSMERLTVDWSSDQEIQRIVRVLVSEQNNTSTYHNAVHDFNSYVTNKKMPYDKSVFMADLLDKNGVVIASTQSSRVGYDEAGEEQVNSIKNFRDSINSDFGKAIVGSIVFDKKESASPIIDVMVHLFVQNIDGTRTPLDAVLLVHFSNIQEIADILSGVAQMKSGAFTGNAFLSGHQTSKIYLVNNKKILVTPTRYTTDVKKQQIADTLPVRSCLENGKEINTEYTDYRGVLVAGASMCLMQEGLVLVVEVDKSEFLMPVTKLIEVTLLAIGSTFILGIFLIVGFVRQPLKRVDEIVDTLGVVMEGNLNIEIKTKAQDEIGNIAMAFNKMIASIRQSQESLQASKADLERSEAILKSEIEERKEQSLFLEDSKRAMQNLLEDSWEVKEKAEIEKGRLQAIISSIGDALILIDADYKISLVNPKATEIFELPREEIVGKDLRNIMDICKKKECLKPALWPTEEVFLTGATVSTTVEDDYSIITKGRSKHLPVMISVAPLHGAAHGAVMVVSDATADHEFNEAKSGFISVASHQLRTPLTSIRWYSEMLLSNDVGTLNDAQKDFMQEIHGGAERLYQTVDLLLGISRVESGKLKAAKTPIDLSLFTGGIKKEMTSQADEKNLNIIITPPDGDSVIVWLDPITLRQVILNLYSNAIRYTNENGLIEVKWWVRDDVEKREVVYAVRDDGIGIPEAVRSRIFSKFFRAENARSQVPDGSGLGLALVKELVESWDGKVWFETEEGKGTTFFFTIPLSSQIQSDDTPKPNAS